MCTVYRFSYIFLSLMEVSCDVEQFKNLPNRSSDSKKCIHSISNMNKNRYNDILAPDHSRVYITGILPYINANYINIQDRVLACENFPRKSIACQGPMENTSSDFWKMVYYKKVKCILMVTPLIEGGMQKCHKYWPSVGESITFHLEHIGSTANNYTLTVSSINETKCDGTTITKISIDGPKGVHTLYHIYHFNWLDQKDTPVDTIVFLLELLRFFTSIKDLFVCHCSAGAGRTGVIFACLRALCTGESVLDSIKKIRIQRHGLVQNAKQYILTEAVVTYMRRKSEKQDLRKNTMLFVKNIHLNIEGLSL